MRKILVAALFILSLSNFAYSMGKEIKTNPGHNSPSKVLKTLIEKRYSCRSFSDKPLKKEELFYILWCCYGKRYDAVTSATRTVPSAGAIYPLNIYVVTAKNGVAGIEAGFYEYLPEENDLKLKREAIDLPILLAKACWGQSFVAEAAVNLIICAEYNRMKFHYGERSIRYSDLEAGHCCQNVNLAVYELGLGTVEVGAFNDSKIKEILNLEEEDTPLIVMPIGYPK